LGDREARRGPRSARHAVPAVACQLDTDRVRDDLRDYVVGQLGDPDAVLVFDETGDVKKGVATVRTQRQYTGTAGRIENAQVDRGLPDLRRAWARADRPRALPTTLLDHRPAAAGRGRGARRHRLLTKPALAAGMLSRALRAGCPRWVAGDEVYVNVCGA
jgi:SRSO17 transposase